jgi:predicted DNA-binding protein with PD1-like motif
VICGFSVTLLGMNFHLHQHFVGEKQRHQWVGHLSEYSPHAWAEVWMIFSPTGWLNVG